MGISVKGLIPDVVRCPLCQKASLTIQYDPIISGGHWLRCSECLFSGDPVELLGKIYGIDDLHDVVAKAKREGLCEDPDTLSDEYIDSYVRLYPTCVRRSIEVWCKLREMCRQLRPDMVQKLQSSRLWVNYASPGRERISQFLGGGLKNDINKLMLPYLNAKALPDKGFSAALALNYQDAPGRPCAFKFLGDDGQELLRFCPRLMHNEDAEGGLAMLETVRPRDEVILALGNYELAFHMQRKWLSNVTEPMHMVVYNDDTRKAWQSLCAKRVVFWNDVINWQLFKQASLVENAEIATRPELRVSSACDYVRDTTPSAIQKLMMETAEPWRRFFVKWIIDPNLPSRKASEVINKLQLSTRERQLLADECPGESKGRLANIMGEVIIVQRAMLRNRVVFEQPDGWWVDHGLRGKELISDAVIKVEKEVIDPSTNRALWVGHVRFHNTPVAFNEAFVIINNNPARWLEKLLAHLGIPYIENLWKGYLVNLAKTFSQPHHVTLTPGLGMRPTGEIVFPEFCIKGGDVKETVGFQEAGMPAVNVRPPVKRQPRECDEPSNVRLAFIALTAGFLTNQVLTMRKADHQPIGAVGDVGSAARTAASHLANISGMQQFFVKEGKQEEIKAFHDKITPYEYTMSAAVSHGGLLKLFSSNVADNLILSMPTLDAAVMAVSGKWRFVDATMLADSKTPLPPFDDVIWYMRDLQMRGYELPEDSPLFEAVLFDFCVWYGKYLGQNGKVLFSDVVKMVRPFMTAGQAFIELYLWMIYAGRVKIEHFAFGDCRSRKGWFNVVCIDDDARKVLLPSSLLFGTRRLFAAPDLTAAMDDLNRSKILKTNMQETGGWIIDLDVWNAHTRVWENRHSLT